MKCKISLIVAFNEKYYIGKDNKLMWNIKDDLQLFKNFTENKIVIMGKNTYDSIGCKPLKNRINVVLSKDMEWVGNLDVEPLLSGDLKIYDNIKMLINKLEELDETYEVFVIGGKTVYSQFLNRNLIDNLYISHIKDNQIGDVKFPYVDWKQWKVVDTKHFKDFVFKKYEKIRGENNMR